MPMMSTVPDCSLPGSFHANELPKSHRFHRWPPKVAVAAAGHAPLLAKSYWIMTSFAFPLLASQTSYMAQALVWLVAFIVSEKELDTSLKSASGLLPKLEL